MNKYLLSARCYTDRWEHKDENRERAEFSHAIFLSAKCWPINYCFLKYDQKNSYKGQKGLTWYPTLNLKVGNLACLNWDYVGTLSHDCFWMLKGLPLFSLTINCSDRKFEFQIIEYIPCTEISSIHAQVVSVIKVPATLPSWMKREEFIKMVSYRGVVWVIVDSCLLCPLGSKLQKQHGNTTKGVQVRHWRTCEAPILYQVILWPISSEDFERGNLLYFKTV